MSDKLKQDTKRTKVGTKNTKENLNKGACAMQQLIPTGGLQ